MTERLEPTLKPSNLPDHASQDQLRTSSSVPNAKVGRRPTPVSQRVVEVKSPLAPLALVASIIALGIAGLLFWQVSVIDSQRIDLQLQLSASSQLLKAADTRIADLESKLTATGDESEQSLATLGVGVKALDADVKENSSEIRKLWGVAHDRNRKSIEENKKMAEAVKSSVESLSSTQQKDLKTLQAAIADLRGELAVLGEVQESQQSALSQSRNVSAELQALKTDLSSRVSASEEAIRSMDAFRLQVNRQLLQMGGTTSP